MKKNQANKPQEGPPPPSDAVATKRKLPPVKGGSEKIIWPCAGRNLFDKKPFCQPQIKRQNVLYNFLKISSPLFLLQLILRAEQMFV